MKTTDEILEILGEQRKDVEEAYNVGINTISNDMLEQVPINKRQSVRDITKQQIISQTKRMIDDIEWKEYVVRSLQSIKSLLTK